MIQKRRLQIIGALLLIFVGCFFYAYNEEYYATGSSKEKQTVLIERGDNALVVADRLEKKSIITNKYFLVLYLWQHKGLHSLVAGVYDFTPGLKIPEIAKMITGGDVALLRIPITFPEGWTSKDMAQRLSANGFDGDGFLVIVNNPSNELKSQYPFLADLPQNQTLEGYLFPDTYYFAKDALAQDIVDKMLKNFQTKITDQMQASIASQHKTLFQIVTMASIVEGEVKTDADRKVVSGIFWNRIVSNIALGSDATLEYVLGTNKLQHSINETQTNSPYNTYRNKGLPPGPVSNPGLNAIMAAIFPTNTDYMYFLSDPKTGKTVFAKTFEEHVANKNKYGL